METIERIFWNWCKLWFVMAPITCVYIWYQGFAHTSQPAVDIIVVGVLGGIAILVPTVLLPGMVFSEFMFKKPVEHDLQNMDGDGI